jgi:hypothetical protein
MCSASGRCYSVHGPEQGRGCGRPGAKGGGAAIRSQDIRPI